MFVRFYCARQKEIVKKKASKQKRPFVTENEMRAGVGWIIKNSSSTKIK